MDVTDAEEHIVVHQLVDLVDDNICLLTGQVHALFNAGVLALLELMDNLQCTGTDDQHSLHIDIGQEVLDELVGTVHSSSRQVFQLILLARVSVVVVLIVLVAVFVLFVLVVLVVLVAVVDGAV